MPTSPGPPRISVKANILDYFHVVFGLRKGQIRFEDFRRAMSGAGYRSRKLFGSVWMFEDESGKVVDINFHEPHGSGDTKIPRGIMSRYKRRLTARYGWTADTFVLEQ